MESRKGTERTGRRPQRPSYGGGERPLGAGWRGGGEATPCLERYMTSDPSLCIFKYLKHRGTCSRAAVSPPLYPFFYVEWRPCCAVSLACQLSSTRRQETCELSPCRPPIRRAVDMHTPVGGPPGGDTGVAISTLTTIDHGVQSDPAHLLHFCCVLCLLVLVASLSSTLLEV